MSALLVYGLVWLVPTSAALLEYAWGKRNKRNLVIAQAARVAPTPVYLPEEDTIRVFVASNRALVEQGY